MKTPELLSDPVYHDEDAARAYLEEVRWPEYVNCPLCGSLDKISKLGGDSMGAGWWYCGSCQDKFTVHKLFEEVAPRYAGRSGGYTRILKLGPRRSDSTEMVFLELV